MPRNGSARGITRLAASRHQLPARQFVLRPPRRTSAQYGLRKLGDFKPKQARAEWQTDAFIYYETLPSIGYVLDHVANTVSACRLRLMEEDPKKGQIPSENDDADQTLRSLVGPRGGLKEVLRRGALLLQIVGEAYLVGTPVEGEVDAIFWEFLSTEELIVPSQPGDRYRRNTNGMDKEDLPNDAYMARMWRSDARASGKAHCGLRRCLDTCRELVLLGQMTEAIISTRLPMGLLLIPDEMSWHSPLHRIDEASRGGDDEVGDEPDFLDDLLAHMGAPIRDFTSAASLVPIVVQGNAEDLKSVRVVELAKDLDQYAKGLRDEMHGRLAIGLDIPPEVLTGKAGLNHWSSFNVDSDFLTRHVQPLGDLIADFLTYAYLRPMLEVGGMGAEEAAKFTLLFDVSPLLTKMDDDQKAIVLWDKGLISDRAVIDKQGWDPDEVMPEKKERQRRLLEQVFMENIRQLSEEGLKLLDLDPKWFEEDAPPPPPPTPNLVLPAGVEPPDANLPEGGDGPPTPRGRQRRGREPDVEAPDENTPDSQSGQNMPERRGRQREQASALIERLVGRVDATFDRAVERAGARALGHAKKVPAYKGRFAGCATSKVLQGITAAELAGLGVTADGLLTDAWTDLRRLTHHAVSEFLFAGGVDPRDADERAAVAASRLVDAVHAFTLERLHEPVPLGADGLRVPARLVVDAVADVLDPVAA